MVEGRERGKGTTEEPVKQDWSAFADLPLAIYECDKNTLRWASWEETTKKKFCKAKLNLCSMVGDARSLATLH